MAMYKKNLNNDLRLRLNDSDMNFLRELADERCISISELIRSIIGEYRRSISLMNNLAKAINLVEKESELSNGDTETNKYDKL